MFGMFGEMLGLWWGTRAVGVRAAMFGHARW